jgi:hypothetical protein
MQYARTSAIAASAPTIFERRAFLSLVSLSAFLLVAYVYLVNQTVWNVVSRQDSAKQVRDASSQVAALESSYMTSSSALTIDHAYLLGFQDIKQADTTFVTGLPTQAVAFQTVR